MDLASLSFSIDSQIDVGEHRTSVNVIRLQN